NANAPSTHHTQYFEMLSVQGLYNDGWMLSAVPSRAPWELAVAPISDPATAYKFELYDLQHDWTQYTDVAASNPNKVQEMTDRCLASLPNTRCCRWMARFQPGSFIRVQASQRAGRSSTIGVKP